MKRLFVLLAALACTSSALAANVPFKTYEGALTAASALGGTEKLPCLQAASDVACTPAQIATYVLGGGSFSGSSSGTNTGDQTITLTGAVTGSGSGSFATTYAGTQGVATGGTGLTSYTTGDLLAATGSTTLASLADAAVGRVLISGGAGVAPSYSQSIGGANFTINQNNNFTTGINAGTSTATVSIGGGLNAVTLNSSALTLSSTATVAGTAIFPASMITGGTFNGATAFIFGAAVSATGLIPTSATCTNQRVNLPAASTIGLCAGGVQALTATSTTVAMPTLAASSAAQTGTVCWTTSTGNLTVDTTTTCLLSDGRLKMNVEPLNVGIAEVMQLKPVSYDLKPEVNPEHLGRQVGLIAQDVMKVDPRLAATYQSGPNKGTPRGVRYEQMVALLVKAVQEQQKEIADLKRKIASLH